jgi:hypothetical protein
MEVLLSAIHTALSRFFLEKLTCSQLVKNVPALYGTRRFNTEVTIARHLSLSSASSIQSIPPHPTSWRSILVLHSHLCLGGLFPSGFPTKAQYTSLLSPVRAICPAHLILFEFITRTIMGEEYRSLSSSLYSFLHSLVTSYLLGPNILLNTLFSNTLNLRSYLNVSDQVLYPYAITGKFIFVYILTVKLWIANWKTKDSAPNDSKHSLTSICTYLWRYYIQQNIRNKLIIQPTQDTIFMTIYILKHCTFLGAVFSFGILSNSLLLLVIWYHTWTTVSLLLIPIYYCTPDEIDQQIDLKTRHTKEEIELLC